ncbi:hypothetical protein ZIOFF_005891 [Zingiber officinale]|uniref:Amino acid transporter transmembrane domain-containing protein n=1 Tax=Zingiber officinale TaxID=94328 RepID=A0A8J5HN19_ZINOF|nr:hypothetical protein ZIOFF_005891 [Zingiber officinale]
MEHLREICKCLKTLVDFLLCHCDSLPKHDPKPWDPPFDLSKPKLDPPLAVAVFLFVAMKAANCVICVEEIKVCAYASEANAKATSSFTHSVINMVGMLIGLGQLSAPYTLENGGWSSAHIIGRCLDDDGGGSKSYQDIGEQAFGSKGRIIASAFIYLEIFFALVSYTISLSDNLPLVLAGLHAHAPWLHLSTAQLLMATAVLVALLVALPTLWLRDMSSISFLSLGGILMSLFMFATVAWVAAFGGVEGSHEIPALRVEMLPRISGLYMFSFAGHIVFPNIYTAMKDPSKFTKIYIEILFSSNRGNA